MLDINLFREKPKIIKEDLKKRGNKEMLPWVDEIVQLDKNWRELIQKRDEFKQLRNKVSKEIATIKLDAEKKKQIAKMAENNKKIEKVEEEIRSVAEKMQYKLDRIPNILDPTVPVGKDDSENVTIKTYSKKPKFDFKPRNHQELCELNDWYDVERGAKVAGARCYFLKNDLARLEFALFSYAIDFFRSKGLTFMITPQFCNKKCFYGTGYLPTGEEDLYKIEKEDLYLIGTSEVPLTSYYMDETLLETDLPIKFCGFSSCFRTEAGSHGKDTKGIFRVHQFNKVEMMIYCKPEESKKMHEFLLKTAEELWQSLGIHYRVVNICTGDIGTVCTKKYDIEAWLPGQDNYREVGSCSNFLDYQARRLNIKYREEEGKPPKGYVHTLNNTGIVDVRGLIAIMENNQTKDGKVNVPKVLQPYMNGKRII
ncbi:MAG: serine--tRNA ligase [Nanoarchaeota archaeon]|nr:serine--tRNA ligase [Nanoarchaeota archaeon]